MCTDAEVQTLIAAALEGKLADETGWRMNGRTWWLWCFATERQCCLVLLLRELQKVDEHNTSAEWHAFAKMLRRLVRDGIRLRKRPDFSPQR